MFDKKIKLDRKDVEELKRCQKLLNEQYFIAEAVNLRIKLFTNEILKKHGLDLVKNYNINLDKGYVVEAEQQTSQQPLQQVSQTK